MNLRPKEKFISLKDAAHISGYTPDYVGQLIRKGKLPGRQVYCTVAWMTTEEAVREYLRSNQSRKGRISWRDRFGERVQAVRSELLLELKLARMVKSVLYLAIFFSVIFSLVLFYILSVSIEHRLQQRALDRIETVKP